MKRLLFLSACASVMIAALAFTMESNAVGSALAVIGCATSVACAGGNNTGTGPGVLGQSTSSHGVIGNTSFKSTGPSNGESAVFGQDLSGSGVYNMGVQGTSVRGYGVRGRSGLGAGVRGDSALYFGVEGTSANNYGLGGLGGPKGVYGYGTAYGVTAMSPNVGVFATGDSGEGVLGVSSSGFGVRGQSSKTFGVSGTSGLSYGGEFSGGAGGVVGRSSSYPLVAANSTGTAVFYVDGNGDIFYHGSVHHLASTGAGGPVETSYTEATAPAVEETGTARLTFGAANVYFSSSFARSIDPRRGYQVFLTPGGDTRGLYVSGKYAQGFVVREVQGGRGTFSFDYHVYAQKAPEAVAPMQPPSVPPASHP